MRIPCPFCGDRDAQEFVYRGDASLTRPTGEDGFYDYVYLRENPAGPIDEHWYHAQGCRTWIVVTRDTRTHAIAGARLAQGAAR
ncbi:MAG: sarcosine oxidase subunit delta [Stutzerimonas stutzeri]|jgi:heterotetrameric sarcosine oxidase delta subunit|uniref:sarcosine oxidase subunit delta n=1 Tax=Novosphingobium sp. B-7 TaxID=1298855 RepID=UPI0003B5C1F2|nr:sarcosine oxidase subunit delta [Novosphingobium sp. B-7]PZR87264.1 MAG: sarcosine oxidase subunit delta [Stutzerimonas stutzeri]